MNQRPESPDGDERQARAEICRVGRRLFGRGDMHASAGNIGVRLADGCLITPTDACPGTPAPERLARLDARGRQPSGARASKAIALHRHLCAVCAASASTAAPARCVIHTHSTSLVSRHRSDGVGCAPPSERSARRSAPPIPSVLASAATPRYASMASADRQMIGDATRVSCSLPSDAAADGPLAPDAQLRAPITPCFVMKLGRVPPIPYHRPGAPEAAEAVAQTIACDTPPGRPIRAVMLARLGPNVWHDSPAAAMAALEAREETARPWLPCQPRHAPTPPTGPRIGELRQTFGAHR